MPEHPTTHRTEPPALEPRSAKAEDPSPGQTYWPLLRRADLSPSTPLSPRRSLSVHRPFQATSIRPVPSPPELEGEEVSRVGFR